MDIKEIWYYDPWTSPYGIGISPNEFLQNNPLPEGRKIKIGVIAFGFNENENLPGSAGIGSTEQDLRYHGTHVAGIIRTLPTASNIMRGLCPLDSFELAYYALPKYNGFSRECPIHQTLSDLFDIFRRCKVDSVSLVHLSMEWCEVISRLRLFNIQLTISALAKMIEDNNMHVVISAGNLSRNLNSSQIDQLEINDSVAYVEVDFFSALAARSSYHVTISGASDVFGHLASFSNYGSMVSLVAPGEHILSTSTSPDGYDVRDGTSQSASSVTGAIALMKVTIPELSYPEIVERLQNTADINFSLEEKCISRGRLNIGRALGLPRSLISEDERLRAYPLRDQAFVAHYEKVSDIIDKLSITDFFSWYNSEHGKGVESKLSCLLLIQALDHLRAVDANEFPFEKREALLEDLGNPIGATVLTLNNLWKSANVCKNFQNR